MKFKVDVKYKALDQMQPIIYTIENIIECLFDTSDAGSNEFS